MPALTPPQIASLRNHPHVLGNQFLYVFQPNDILTAQVIGNIGRVQTIPTTAATAAALRGMTLWVGTAVGAHDKGKIRIRANGAGNNLYVSEHEINLANGDYLTVKNNYELWHVDPYINPVTGAINKDWDGAAAIAFPGANAIYQPIPVMGPHSIQWSGEGHDWDWTRSWAIAPGVVVTNYAGTFPGGVPANSVLPVGTVTWATAGARWVTLSVRDGNGTWSELGKRLFVTLDPAWEDENGLYVSFAPSARMGDMGNGGFSMSFTVFVDAPEEDFPDGALVIWFHDGGSQEDIGGNWPDRSHILFVGAIRRDSAHKEPETGQVTFEAVTIQELMRTCPSFPNFVEVNVAPTVWTQAADLTVQRAAYLHMRWNSSLLEVADVIFEPAATTTIGEHEFQESDLYTQLDTLVSKDCLYRIGCDYQSTIYFNKDPQFQDTAARLLIDTIMTMDGRDWQGEIELPEPLLSETAYVMASGIAYAAGVVTPLFSEAPGPIPLQHGRKEKGLSSLICTTQGALNTLSGLTLAQANCRYPDIPVAFEGQYKGLDHLFPMEFMGLQVETKREDVDELFIPRRSSFQVVYDEHGAPSHGMVSVNLELVTDGPDGQTLTYPTEPPDPPGPDEGPDNDWLPPPPPPPGPAAGDGHLLYFVDGSDGHIYRTRNARDPVAPNVVYEDLGVVDAGGLYYIALDSWDPKNTAMVCGPNGIWRTTNLDSAVPAWTQVLAVGYITMVVSSICQQDLWMACRQYLAGVDHAVDVYWSINGGDFWSNVNLAGDANAHVYGTKIECSSHSAQKAWVTWMCGDGTTRVAVTGNQWAAHTVQNAPTPGWSWPANPHHRFHTNPNDLIGFWSGADVTNICTADYGTCTAGALDAGGSPWTPWIGSYTWGVNKYWALTDGIVGGWVWRFHVSDDAINWTLQYTFPTGSQYISGWPYNGERFYATQNPDATPRGPIMISDDRGATWQDQLGNWGVLVGWTGDIRCCVPVWVA